MHRPCPHAGGGVTSRSWLDHFEGDEQRLSRTPPVDSQTFL